MPEIVLSLATLDDSDDLYCWRNDEITRSMFINTEPVRKQDHDKWIQTTLQNPDRILLIAHFGTDKIGTIRFDIDERTALVSITVSPQHRGKKLASAILLAAENTLPQKITTLRAEIKTANCASIKSFQKAGFLLTEQNDTLAIYQKKKRNNKMNNILVVAAHPDDEILGCGGTMAKHIDQGDNVHVVIMAEGLTSRYNTREEAFKHSQTMQTDLDLLKETARKANAILGVNDVYFEGFPDNRMDSVDLLDIVKRIEFHIQRTQPDAIYTHHVGDVNIDHQQIHNAVITASRPMPGGLKPTLLFFEVASSTHWRPPVSAQPFNPNWFVDITHQLERKLSALSVYEGEMRPWPHARSVKALEHLAHWNGANIATEAAECFALGRYYA